MKNIHVLPTDKPTKLFTSDSELILTGYPVTTFKTGKHIYITSEKDIKDNDWIITKDGRLVQVSYLLSKELDNASKIILTTDQDLINDGVQAIDDEFLEWFVKNPSCDNVEVVDGIYFDDVEWISCYKIIIPKKEPKQETLEDAAKNFIENTMKFSFISNDTKTQANRMLKCVEFGAKWQQEQNKKLYSEEEVLSILKARENYLDNYPKNSLYISIKEFFEQFKKK